MKYYSEILDKKFDTEEELFKAEKEYTASEEKEETTSVVEETTEPVVVSNKKELAKAVDAATDALNSAYEQYEIAKSQARDVWVKAQKESRAILDEAGKECEDILAPAKAAIKDAQANRLSSLRDFNNKYGVYTTTLTGDKAIQEIRRMDSWMTDQFSHFNNLFRNWWF